MKKINDFSTRAMDKISDYLPTIVFGMLIIIVVTFGFLLCSIPAILQ